MFPAVSGDGGCCGTGCSLAPSRVWREEGRGPVGLARILRFSIFPSQVPQTPSKTVPPACGPGIPRRRALCGGCPRPEWQGVEGGSEQGGEEGWRCCWRDQETFLCAASPGTENLATEQAGVLEARQLPLATEASPFPPRKTDTPAPPVERVGVFVADKPVCRQHRAPTASCSAPVVWSGWFSATLAPGTLFEKKLE